MWFFYGCMTLGLPLFLTQPKTLCKDPISLVPVNCDPEDLDQLVETSNSLLTEFDLPPDSPLIGFAYASFFLGSILAGITYPILNQQYGEDLI